jgi:hypothetical protein
VPALRIGRGRPLYRVGYDALDYAKPSGNGAGRSLYSLGRSSTPCVDIYYGSFVNKTLLFLLPYLAVGVAARQRRSSGSQTAVTLGSRSLTMSEGSGSRSVPMGSRSVTRARQRTVRLTLADNGEKASLQRHLPD